MTNLEVLWRDLQYKFSDPIRGPILADEVKSENTITSFVLANVLNDNVSDREFRQFIVALLLNEGYGGGYKSKLNKIWF